jgi:hypothetical protein
MVTQPQNELWEEHPADCLRAHEAHLRNASQPLLRAYSASVLAQSEYLLETLPDAFPTSLFEVYSRQQVQRLLCTKRIILAMQVMINPPLLYSVRL